MPLWSHGLLLVCPNFLLVKDTSHWMRACHKPIWPHLNLITSAKTILGHIHRLLGFRTPAYLLGVSTQQLLVHSLPDRTILSHKCPSEQTGGRGSIQPRSQEDSCSQGNMCVSRWDTQGGQREHRPWILVITQASAVERCQARPPLSWALVPSPVTRIDDTCPAMLPLWWLWGAQWDDQPVFCEKILCAQHWDGSLGVFLGKGQLVQRKLYYPSLLTTPPHNCCLSLSESTMVISTDSSAPVSSSGWGGDEAREARSDSSRSWVMGPWASFFYSTF